MPKAAFLDRDGVINRKAPAGKYIVREEDVEILPGVEPAIRHLNRAGYAVVVITNQRCVAKGLIGTRELEKLHATMRERLASAGARIDAVYYCPHELLDGCACRKPAPGMLLEASRTHDFDLPRSWMIGDSESDITAGRQSGCRTVRIWENDRHGVPATGADLIAPCLLEAVRQIFELEKIPFFRPQSDSEPGCGVERPTKSGSISP
ncbi:MAG TPA: HAD family hydrolase [Bryobacteraceae bacterium]|nr:HAD family hydrolase [Bryobacteraceae bacterium]